MNSTKTLANRIGQANRRYASPLNAGRQYNFINISSFAISVVLLLTLSCSKSAADRTLSDIQFGIATAQNPIVITSCGAHPDESCILITIKAHDSIRETNLNDVSVEIGNLQLAPRVFHFTNDNTFLLYCYPMQQGVPLPDESKFRAAKVRVDGKWYNGHSGTVLVPHDGYSGLTVFTTAALSPRYQGNGNQLWTYLQPPPNSQFVSELRSSDKRVLKVITTNGESGDSIDTGLNENSFFLFGPEAHN